MRIVSVASALPDNVYRQEEITTALKDYWGDKLSNHALLDRLHSRTGVRKRHLAYSFDDYRRFSGFGDTNRAWFEAAERLGAGAIDAALGRAGLVRADLDAIYVVSITGIASPSLDARLINRMGLRPDIKRTPIFGLGCVAGAVGITRAADHVRAWPAQTAALLSVELCSLTMRLDDLSMANLISMGLFSDGAVAAIVAGRERAERGPEVLATRSAFYPQTEGIMGWDISEKGFGIVLSPELPNLIRSRLGSDVDLFLSANGFSRADLGSWVIHPGGPKVLEAVEDALGLRKCELAASWESLARHGNLSSGSVLLVLEETMRHRRPAPGTPGLIMAMGPGFCAEMILVRW